jgi:DNA modification methylase
MIADILLDASARDDLVLDPFGGAGTMLIAAEKVGRRARVLEIEPRYVDVAIQRWERWTGEAAVLETDNRTFRDVEAQRAEEAGQ